MGWSQEYNPYFRDRHVAIIPDADGPGRRHAQNILANLKGIAATVMILELPIGRMLLEQLQKARYAAAGLTKRPNKRDKVGLILDRDLSASAKLLLLALLERCENGSVDFVLPSALVPAGWCSQHRATAQNNVQDLVRAGIIRRSRRSARIAWDILAALFGARRPTTDQEWGPTRAVLRNRAVTGHQGH
jgi:hypothetical protein